MKLKKLLLLGLLFGSGLFFNSCSDKNYYDYENQIIIEGSIIYTDNIIIGDDKRGWNWSEVFERYECSVDFPILEKEDVFRKDVVLAYLYWLEEDVLIQKSLPFSREFVVDEGTPNERIVAERFSYDISQGDVTFFIEYSDKQRRDHDLDAYEFKVNIITPENINK